MYNTKDNMEKTMIPVIVVVCNRPDYTKPCLEALFNKNSGTEIMPVIVDNASRPSTSDIIAQFSPSKIIRIGKNAGFAGGVNAALNWLASEDLLKNRICILHNDTIVTHDWLKEMDETLSADDDCGISMPTTNYANEHSMCDMDIRMKFEVVKPSNKDRILKEQMNDILAKTYDGTLDEHAEKVKKKAEKNYRYCPEISSFCMLVRENLFTQYGLFDESFWPRGYEDKFWFSSLEIEGWICCVAQKAFVHHFGNITSDSPGFSFPDIMRINEEKYKGKIEQRVREGLPKE